MSQPPLKLPIKRRVNRRFLKVLDSNLTRRWIRKKLSAQIAARRAKFVKENATREQITSARISLHLK